MSDKTNKQKFLKRFGLPETASLSINDVSSLTGIPEEALQVVYNRGVGAWKTNPESVRIKFSFHKDKSAPRQSRISKEAWGMARVYSFVMKGKTYKTADSDIAEKYNV